MKDQSAGFAMRCAGACRLLLLVAAGVVAMAPALGADEWELTARGDQSVLVESPTRMKDIDNIPGGTSFATMGDDVKVTMITRRFPFDPAALGHPRPKGTVTTEFDCFGAAGRVDFPRSREKFDRFGNAVGSVVVPGEEGCTFLGTSTSFKGNQKQPGGTSINLLSGFQRLSGDADADCGNVDTLCLGSDNRFKVDVEWRTASASGSAVPLASGQDTGTFYFFSPTSEEMLVKVLDGCDVNNHYWIFFGGATDVGFDLTVTDTATGQGRSYSNPLGTASPAVTDTTAFATCP